MSKARVLDFIGFASPGLIQRLDEVLPTWSQALDSTDGEPDGCSSSRFKCVLGFCYRPSAHVTRFESIGEEPASRATVEAANDYLVDQIPTSRQPPALDPIRTPVRSAVDSCQPLAASRFGKLLAIKRL